MSNHPRPITHAIAEVASAVRAAAGFLLTIEVWMMVVVAAATVAGFWLAFVGNPGSLLAFAFAAGYLAARVVLHLKRILSWPFM